MPALAKTEIIARAKKVPVTAYYGINESPCHSRGVSYLERHYLDARYIIHFLHDGPCGQVVFRNETHGKCGFPAQKLSKLSKVGGHQCDHEALVFTMTSTEGSGRESATNS